MSWDKNTVVISEIDTTLEVLREIGVPHVLRTWGCVYGRGLNDDTETRYPMRLV